MTFIFRLRPYYLVHFAQMVISYRAIAKYLGIQIAERLTYSTHVHLKRHELHLLLRQFP